MEPAVPPAASGTGAAGDASATGMATQAARPPSSDPAALPARRLGDFELVREIGRGGMGVVYEVRQSSLQRRVALKVLPPGLGLSREGLARFEREARAAAALHHTNIVPVYAIGEDQGFHFYAMELIEGASPSHPRGGERATPGRLDAGAAGDGRSRGVAGLRGLDRRRSGQPLLRHYGTALVRAPSRACWPTSRTRCTTPTPAESSTATSSPPTCCWRRIGRLCLTDFGLARVTEEPRLTVSGAFLGTPAYMSPEQIASGKVPLDHRTDIYSLGAVLYEMLDAAAPVPGRFPASR